MSSSYWDENVRKMELILRGARRQDQQKYVLPKREKFVPKLPLRQDNMSLLSNGIRQTMINLAENAEVKTVNPHQTGDVYSAMFVKRNNAENSSANSRMELNSAQGGIMENNGLRRSISSPVQTPRPPHTTCNKQDDGKPTRLQYETTYTIAYQEPTRFPNDLFDFENKTSVSSSTTPMNHHPPARSVAKQYRTSKFAFPTDILEPRESLEAIYETKFHHELKRPLFDSPMRHSFYSRNFRGPLIYQGKNSKKVVSMESGSKASVGTNVSISRTSVSKYSDLIGLPTVSSRKKSVY